MFSNRSISKVILVIVVLSMAVISLILPGSIAIIQTSQVRMDLIEQIESEMSILSQDFVKILLLDDIEQAADLTSKLRALSPIHNLVFVNQENEVVFSYFSESAGDKDFFMVEDSSDLLYRDKYLDTRLPVKYQGVNYGNLMLRYDTAKYDQRISQYYRYMALAMLALLLVAFVIARVLQRYISDPIIRLAESTKQIARSKDYSARLSIKSNGEIGFLYEAFNYFLGEIERSNDQVVGNEERLAGLIDIVGSGIISINSSQKIILFNRRAEEIFGYDADVILGKDLSILLPERFRKAHAELLSHYSVHGESRQAMSRPGKVFGLRANGEEFPIDASISRFEYSGEEIMTVSLEDISWRVEAERELKKYQERLEELVKERTAALETSNRELESYSYTIAHDLRTPLRGITSFSQILMEDAHDKLNDAEKDALQRIIKAGGRMSDLIEDILELSRISRSELKRVKVDISLLAKETLDEISADKTDYHVDTRIDSDLYAYADESLTRVLLQNLLDNAVKFSRKNKEPRIEVAQKLIEGQYFFYVQDNGIGIDMKYSHKLFKAFERLHTSVEYEGTGIGLATAERIVSLHGGRIWAESEHGKGTALYFSLERSSSQYRQLNVV